ncbi:unnamed protein product [Nezara viridula]|uniref:Uncharacterized protein n=1 Tax=Nezara viridula TaxID=85310 RepID=A0A9P0GYJ9_NEZVI|nr:unnamed protein product [Nezara viridula]
MPIFRNHIYFGIGNPISDDPPFDRDDEIARDHDIAYCKAKTFDDIKNADSKAIREFWMDLLETSNWHSLVGAVALGVKTGAERIVCHPIYPWKPGSSCRRRIPSAVDGLGNVEEAREQKKTSASSVE